MRERERERELVTGDGDDVDDGVSIYRSLNLSLVLKRLRECLSMVIERRRFVNRLPVRWADALERQKFLRLLHQMKRLIEHSLVSDKRRWRWRRGISKSKKRKKTKRSWRANLLLFITIKHDYSLSSWGGSSSMSMLLLGIMKLVRMSIMTLFFLGGQLVDRNLSIPLLVFYYDDDDDDDDDD